MKFEKVDLFCPKCGKYSLYRSGRSMGCNMCLSTFGIDYYKSAKWLTVEELKNEGEPSVLCTLKKRWNETSGERLAFKTPSVFIISNEGFEND